MLLGRIHRILIVALVPVITSCGSDGGRGDAGDGTGSTSQVGGFDGLFDNVATGFNFPFDVGIVPLEPEPDAGVVEYGDLFVANYGTSEIMVSRAPNTTTITASSFYEGPSDGLMGAMAVSVPSADVVWAAFEQGGVDGRGGIAVLSTDGTRIRVIDTGSHAEAFANPGGICWGGWNVDETLARFFMVNLGDGTVWRITATDLEGTGAEFTRVGLGLATGILGNPSVPGSPLSSSNDTPEGGARGCAYADGRVYVADAQNARVVRFDGVDDGVDVTGVGLEDTPPELVTYPTGVSVNDLGDLIVISFDNAHAFVSLVLPSGGFLDNGLHDLNVNSGNHGMAVAKDTIWFTRANNSNGALRAVTRSQSDPPSSAGPFPPQ